MMQRTKQGKETIALEGECTDGEPVMPEACYNETVSPHFVEDSVILGGIDRKCRVLVEVYL